MVRIARGVCVATVATAVATGGTPVGGCGGDDGEPNASIESVPTTPGQAPGRESRRQARRGDSPKARLKESGVRFEPRTARERAIARAGARLPQRKRAEIVKTVASAVFSRFGFHPLKLTVTPSATGLRATLGAREACTATTTTERALASKVHEAIPWVRSVQIVVGSTGESVSRYVRTRCRPVELPGGDGPVVLTQRGTVMATTKSFTVHSDRWTVEYVNGGSRLHILVMKAGGLPSAGSFQVPKRGPGRHVVKGAGKFSLRIAGAGEWVVRVRDGA